MMNKKILLVIGILIFAGFLIAWQYQTQDKSTLRERFQEFKQEFREKKAQGYDVSEAENLIRQAREAHQKGDKNKAGRLLTGAFKALEKAERIAISEKPEIPAIPEKVKEETRGRLSQVRVAVVYERVTGGALIGRSVEDVIRILNETKTDFIFRGFWRWRPVPESPETASALIYPRHAVKTGYTYEQLREAINKIRREMPDVIFGGGVSAQRLNRIERNPLTGEILGQEETWKMAFDPGKWGIDMSKEEFQTKWAIDQGWIEEGQPYNPKEEAESYFPDVTNPNFQELFLSWAKKQIDCGVDACWIDMLFRQARELRRMTGDINHPAVIESYDASSEIVDKIHEYGYSKGKYIYVITWADTVIREFPYPPDLDAVMTTPSSEEVSSMSLDKEKWEYAVSEIRAKFGDIPIFARIDFGGVRSPLEVFSQELTIDQANQFLRTADEFLQKKGVNLIYPIHGGVMGVYLKPEKVKKLSYGKFNWYDSLAPEFDTYETIKELAIKKTKNPEKSTGAYRLDVIDLRGKNEKTRLLVMLAHSTSVNFSVHSQMPAKTTYKQDHKKSVSLDPNKIYIAFAMSNLGLNSMQDRYYGAWDDPKRGNLPVSWWMEGVVKDFGPGIVQYFYETKTPNDYFYGAHVGGRIRPSDFPNLEEYLKRNKKYLEALDLKTVAFSNHGKKDDYVFETYSRVLDNCIGFFYGWSPEFELGPEAAGLVILGDYPTVDFLEKVKEKTDLLYPGQIEWVRGDELILAAEKHAKGK